jgi:Tfp pilus assembly protein PilF
MQPSSAAALEQLASLHAEAGEATQLEGVVERLRALGPESAATHYYAAVASFLRGDAARALAQGEDAIAADPQYAAVYDLVGAALTTLDRPDRAREAFMTSLRFNAHDSTAYANLGLLALRAGDTSGAIDYFAEALWLESDMPMAREGLSASLSARRNSGR